MLPDHRWQWVADGEEKTALLRDRILDGALHPAVREVAVMLVKMCDRNDHHERLARLHRFVRDAVDYHQESVELFQHPAYTLEHGGDCDDLTALLGALAWTLRYPWLVEPYGDPLDPRHYALDLGWPTAELPHGDAHTVWIHTEPSAAAAFGELTEAAASRGAVL